jgi:hypothetical protein
MAIETCGDQKPSDENLWWKCMVIEILATKLLWCKRHFSHHKVYDDQNSSNFSHP